MSTQDRELWDQRYRAGDAPTRPTAREWLVDHCDLVDALAGDVAASRTPQALDVACGAGSTAIWLAGRGWQATGVDISQEALDLARAQAQRVALAHRCRFLQRDLDHWRPLANRYDLVTLFYFLEQGLWPGLREAVRPSGLLICETFNRHRLQHKPDTNPNHLLQPGKLAQMVSAWGWTILDYRSQGPENAYPTDALVARRPVLPDSLC